jgi:hypothetical protein
MRNVSDRSCRENQNTHFLFNTSFFFENSPIYDIMRMERKDTARQSTDDDIMLPRRDVICMQDE